MHICPACLSMESATHCTRCGARADLPSGPLFWCTLGWSRSRDYESILRRFQAEPDYRCVETAEEVLHQVPLADIAAAESFIRRFSRAMLWKETRLETPGGIVFALHKPVGNCFLRRVTEGGTPCLQETPSCPFLKNQHFPETGIAGAAQLAASLLQQADALACPYARRLAENAFESFCGSGQVPFVVAAARRAMETGGIVMTAQGAFTPRASGAEPWPTRPCPDIPPDATWAACSGTLQLAVVEDQLRIYPAGLKVAPWLSASLVAPTRDGRHVGIPAPHAADPFFLLFDEAGQTLSCGPFPLPFSLDSQVRHVAFAHPSGNGGRTVKLATFVGGVHEPFWLQTGSWSLPEPVMQLVCESETVAVLAETGHVWRLDSSGKTEPRHFPECLQITLLESGTLAILWQNGWRLTFWDAVSVRNFSLLVPARRIFPSQYGNLAAVAPGRITEIAPDGTVVDFRCADALWMSRRGYMEQTPDGYFWHILNDTPIHGDFWKSPPANYWMVAPAEEVHIHTDDELFPLAAEVVSYFLSKLPLPTRGELTRLISGAPARVQKEFRHLLQRHPWIRNFDGPMEAWPVTARKVEDLQNIE